MDATTQHILIAGGSGFLGTALRNHFENKGHQVSVLSRNASAPHEIQWDGKTLDAWAKAIEQADIVINLCGKNVNCRYTKKNRTAILNSRLETTAILCEAIQVAKNPPKVWLNASSATIYVHAEHELMTEDEGIIGDDFSMSVCKNWEKQFFSCQFNHTRRVALRTSIVLGEDDGAFPLLNRLSKFGMGGKQGNGRQFFSWIHLQDFCRAVEYIIQNPGFVGPVNVTAPNPIRNKKLMRLLRQQNKMPFGLPQPKWLLELGAALIGTETELLLKSRNVYPERLLENGFEFEIGEIEDALNHLT